jgi:D-serine deaminase-like pyridoxal phosphate-dependent protein
MIYEPSIGTHVQELDTPVLLLDLDRFERNIKRMATFFAGRPANLRPHAKSHKCPRIALRQLAAGAVGITCAKLGEAEVMAAAGARDILIANEVVGIPKVLRLAELADRCNLMVAVDDAANVEELSAACRARGVSLRVLVEVDIGMQRCGVQPGSMALALARQVTAAPHLSFVGLQGYEGHLVGILDPQERADKVRAAMGLLQETKDLLEMEGLPVPIVSGGGTGTYDVSGSIPPMNEIQAGSYVFMDTKYIQVRPEFESSLTVLTMVLSRPVPERIIVDAGMKAMTHEFGWPEPLGVPGASVVVLSEEHGKLEVADPGAVSLRPGDRVRFMPSHGCTTVNLHDALYVVQDDVLVDIWPIEARGRAR